MLQLQWAVRTEHCKGGQQCDTGGLMSTGKIKPDFPTLPFLEMIRFIQVCALGLGLVCRG